MPAADNAAADAADDVPRRLFPLPPPGTPPPAALAAAPTSLLATPAAAAALAAAAASAAVCISATVRINAPAAVAFSFLTRPSTWSRWNSFVPVVDVVAGAAAPPAPPPPPPATTTAPAEAPPPPEIAAGSRLRFHANMSAHSPAPSKSKLLPVAIRVDEVSTPDDLGGGNGDDNGDDNGSARRRRRLWRVVWTGELPLPAFMFSSPGRVQELDESPDGRSCVYRSWELQNGVAAHATRMLYGAVLDKRFLEWAADLKRISEDPTHANAPLGEGERSKGKI
ncbi:hypothetical protein DFJ73DRAFT_792701 [Zopfochytrium polystomum]|nr:hypothetical protein DFJ73DRAFT_792701 [Zopfochytrium polystomum]